MKWWKAAMKTMVLGCMAALFTAVPAFAAGWVLEPDSGRWWYDLGGGQYYASDLETPRWEWLDGNGDGIAECYAFDQAGWMYADVSTPDGYEVNADGAWTVDGVVQAMTVAAGYAGSLGQANTAEDGGNRILIAYFSHTGTTEEAARQIQAVAGGDLFEIQTVDAYPSTYQATVDAARNELERNARPALAAQVENMEDYDVILVGYPIWWHTAPMAVNTFLESYDLSGKTILPFCTSGGSSIEESMESIQNSAGNAAVGTGLTANSLSEERILSWLEENRL